MLVRLVEALGPVLVRLIMCTVRMRFEPKGVEEARRRAGERMIFPFWHGRMLIPAYTHRFKNIAILVSRHKDGEFIARVVRRLGFRPVRGSTTRGGGQALMGVMREARAGHDISFTPDGPRGPRYKVQRGVIYAASRTGLSIVPVALEVSSAWVLGSWDEFTIPKPFSRGIMLHGDPMPIPPGIEGEELEAHRLAVEREMHRLMGRAREMVATPPGRSR